MSSAFLEGGFGAPAYLLLACRMTEIIDAALKQYP